MSTISRLTRWFLEKFGTLGRFLISGGTALFVLLALLYFLTDILGIWYLASSIVALIGAFITSFTLHKFWTFQDQHLGRIPIQMTSHLGVGAVNLVLNTGLLYILVDYFRLYYLLSQVLISGSIAFASFFIYKHLIFYRGRAGARPEQLETHPVQKS